MRLDAVLAAVADGTWRGDADTALAAARGAVRAAQGQAFRANQVSFYGDLADRALHATLAGAAARPETLATTPAAVGSFLGNLVAVAIDHVVARDLTAHLGRGSLAGAARTVALRRELVQRARQVATDQRVASALAAAAHDPRGSWAALLARVWEVGATIPPAAGGGAG